MRKMLLLGGDSGSLKQKNTHDFSSIFFANQRHPSQKDTNTKENKLKFLIANVLKSPVHPIGPV